MFNPLLIDSVYIYIIIFAGYVILNSLGIISFYISRILFSSLFVLFMVCMVYIMLFNGFQANQYNINHYKQYQRKYLKYKALYLEQNK